MICLSAVSVLQTATDQGQDHGWDIVSPETPEYAMRKMGSRPVHMQHRTLALSSHFLPDSRHIRDEYGCEGVCEQRLVHVQMILSADHRVFVWPQTLDPQIVRNGLPQDENRAK
jgi:hypothetical protein